MDLSGFKNLTGLSLTQILGSAGIQFDENKQQHRK
jgi:hypothetical protein